jgi:hypothetical protein
LLVSMKIPTAKPSIHLVERIVLSDPKGAGLRLAGDSWRHK